MNQDPQEPKTVSKGTVGPRSRRTPQPKDRLAEARAVTFEMVKVRRSGGTGEVTHLRAYLDRLQRAAMDGDIEAVRELREFDKYLENLGILAKPLVRSKASLDMEERTRDHKRTMDYANGMYLLAYVGICFRLRLDYIKQHGCEPDFVFEAPYWLDLVH